MDNHNNHSNNLLSKYKSLTYIYLNSLITIMSCMYLETNQYRSNDLLKYI